MITEERAIVTEDCLGKGLPLEVRFMVTSVESKTYLVSNEGVAMTSSA